MARFGKSVRSVSDSSHSSEATRWAGRCRGSRPQAGSRRARTRGFQPRTHAPRRRQRDGRRKGPRGALPRSILRLPAVGRAELDRYRSSSQDQGKKEVGDGSEKRDDRPRRTCCHQGMDSNALRSGCWGMVARDRDRKEAQTSTRRRLADLPRLVRRGRSSQNRRLPRAGFRFRGRGQEPCADGPQLPFA